MTRACGRRRRTRPISQRIPSAPCCATVPPSSATMTFWTSGTFIAVLFERLLSDLLRASTIFSGRQALYPLWLLLPLDGSSWKSLPAVRNSVPERFFCHLSVLLWFAAAHLACIFSGILKHDGAYAGERTAAETYGRRTGRVETACWPRGLFWQNAVPPRDGDDGTVIYSLRTAGRPLR